MSGRNFQKWTNLQSEKNDMLLLGIRPNSIIFVPILIQYKIPNISLIFKKNLSQINYLSNVDKIVE